MVSSKCGRPRVGRECCCLHWRTAALSVRLMQTFVQDDGRINAADLRLGTAGTLAAFTNAKDAAEDAGRSTVLWIPPVSGISRTASLS